MLAFLLLMVFLAPVSHAGNGHIACFVYHRFGDDRYPSTNISTNAFRAQLAYLRQNNFTVWTMGRATESIRKGEEIPPRTVVLTIDDAYQSFYEQGLPLLEEFGYPATLYVNTANVGHPDFLNWREIRDAQERDIEIGNHSHSHGHFLDIPDGERGDSFFSDLNKSQMIFFDSLGFSPDLYSYPYGEYDAIMEKVLKNAGFISAAAQYSGILYEGTNLYEIPRFPMGGPFATLKGFIQKSQMRPFKVLDKETISIVMEENPPMLVVSFSKDCIDTEFLQCFVNGERNCITEMQESPEKVRIKVTSRDVLPGRRSLYTITAPARNGKGWCWYSHVWVNTSVRED
jgi:peptidoglycan/xylan/chitin deacetylase (PgdA/CDA1 family)